MRIILLDGPLGTELGARGYETGLPWWSAGALEDAPELVAAIHGDYADAGAVVHTANTFRTQARTVGKRWEAWTRRAVEIARASVPSHHRVAGSIAPLEDCYRPDLSPADPGPEHRAMAQLLADAGCDLLLCETFPHLGEAWAAVEEAVATGVETWLSLTAGPDANLLTPAEIERGARGAIDRGARAVLVNCVPASETARFLAPLAELGVPFGAYANAGRPDERLGWRAAPDEIAATRYAEHAQAWVDRGAVILGGCCGTGPAHVRALSTRFCR